MASCKAKYDKSCTCSADDPRIDRCDFKDPGIVIRKLWEILDDEFGAKMLWRHSFLLDLYLQLADDGFAVADLKYIRYVLHRLLERVPEVPQYRQPLERLLELACKMPLFTAEESDEEENLKQIVDYFTSLGVMMVRPPNDLQRSRLLLVVHRLITQHDPTDHQRAPYAFRIQALTQSKLPRTVARLLKIATVGSQEVYKALLHISQQLVTQSLDIAVKMYQADCLETLLIHLDPIHFYRDERQPLSEPLNLNVKQYDDEILNMRLCLLWSLLDRIKQLRPDERTLKPSRRALWSLRYAFRIEVWKKRATMRNSYIGLFCFIVDLFPELSIVEAGLAQDILKLSVAIENRFEVSWIPPGTFTKSFDDLDFKKHLLLALCYLSKYSATLKIMVEHDVMWVLLQLVNPQISNIFRLWSREQYWELLIISLRCLCVLVPIMPQEFMKHRGADRLLLMVELFMKKPYDEEALNSCLKIMCSLIKFNNEYISHIIYVGGIHVITTLCDHLLAEKYLPSSVQRLLTRCFFILEVLIRNRPIVHQSYGETCVSLAMGFLTRVIKQKPFDLPLDDCLIICVLNYLWESVIWNKQNMNLFVKSGGPYQLLDILENSILPVQVMVLAMLTDLCEDGKCVPHLTTWRGGKNHRMVFLELLASIWRAEETKRGVKRDSQGCVTDVEWPLRGKLQEHQMKLLEAGSPDTRNSSPAIVDLMGSVRPKIYAILTLLEYRHAECVRTAQKYYRIGLEPLSPIDQVTLEVARAYLPLKMAEVWTEVRKYLELNGIRPFAPDGGMLCSLVKEHLAWANAVCSRQRRILHDAELKEAQRREDILNTRLECEADLEAEVLHRLQDFVRDTDRHFRRSLKRREQGTVDLSLALNLAHASPLLHRTYKADNSNAMLTEQAITLHPLDLLARRTTPVWEAKGGQISDTKRQGETVRRVSISSDTYSA